jgi:hypothetical protein
VESRCPQRLPLTALISLSTSRLLRFRLGTARTVNFSLLGATGSDAR